MSDVKSKTTPLRPNALEDDDAAMPKMVKKAGPIGRLLPTGLSRAVVISTFIVCTTLWVQSLYSARYDLVAPGKAETTFMYRLDRWTGAVSLCTAQSCKPLPTAIGSTESKPASEN